MVRQLEETQIETAALNDERILMEFGGVRTGYQSAFRGYGLDLARFDPSEFARRIRESPARQRLIAALDAWAIYERPGPRRVLLNLIGMADDDLWRKRFRDAIANHDRTALRSLAFGDEVLSQPPLTILHLALKANAELTGEDIAVNLLRRAQRLHPTDFCINEFLGLPLDSGPSRRGIGLFANSDCQQAGQSRREK